MQMRTVAFAAALAALTATATAAQRQPAARPAQPAPPAAQTPAAAPNQTPGPMQGGAMRGGLAGWLATNPSDLNLTADQLSRLGQVNQRLQQSLTPLRQQIAAATANRDVSALTLADRHALMMSTRELGERMRATFDTAQGAAIAVLTPEQQQRVQAMHRGGPGGRLGMRGGMGGRMAMRGGMGGGVGGPMMGPPMGGPGMMGQHRPMMGRGRGMMRAGMRAGFGMGWRGGMRAGMRMGRGW
jgi:hypothetical protein